MSASAALTNLASFLSQSLTLEAATIAKPARGTQVPDVRVLSLAADAEHYFTGVINDRVGRHLAPGAWTLRQLDPLYKPDDAEVEWEAAASIPEVTAAASMLTNLSSYGPFAPNDEKYKKRLSYWAVVLSAGDGTQALFFRSFTSSAELKRKPGAAMVSSSGVFTRVKDAIFFFDDRVDCFVYGGYIFVLRKLEFRRIFDQRAAVLAKAKAAAHDVQQLVPIANFAEFQQACGTDGRLADKLLAIHNRDYFSQLSYSMLKPVIAQFQLQIPTKVVNGVTQLVFEKEPAGRFRILKLMDDDYLRSAMTNHGYEVNSKSEAN